MSHVCCVQLCGSKEGGKNNPRCIFRVTPALECGLSDGNDHEKIRKIGQSCSQNKRNNNNRNNNDNNRKNYDNNDDEYDEEDDENDNDNDYDNASQQQESNRNEHKNDKRNDKNDKRQSTTTTARSHHMQTRPRSKRQSGHVPPNYGYNYNTQNQGNRRQNNPQQDNPNNHGVRDSGSNRGGWRDSHSTKPEMSSGVGNETQCQVISCILRELRMTDKQGYADRGLVSQALTKNVRNQELRNFLQESTDDCFELLHEDSRKEPCEYSNHLISCLVEKGRNNCDDWQEQTLNLT